VPEIPAIDVILGTPLTATSTVQSVPFEIPQGVEADVLVQQLLSTTGGVRILLVPDGKQKLSSAQLLAHGYKLASEGTLVERITCKPRGPSRWHLVYVRSADATGDQSLAWTLTLRAAR